MRAYLLALALVSGVLLPVAGQAQVGVQVRSQGSYLGVRLVDLDADRAKALNLPEARGVEVTGVVEGSPAETAGIREGDVLIGYNGENIVGAEQFARLVQETPQGRKVKVQLWRGGKTETVTVVTGSQQYRFQAPTWFNVKTSDMPGFYVLDVPMPMLLWKNALLGIDCEPIESQLAQYFGVKRGVLIRFVESRSAAERAGLKAGDVVTSIGDRAVANPHDMMSYMREHRTGNSVAISLVRDHRPMTVTIAIPENQE
jgi:serine protease Do